MAVVRPSLAMAVPAVTTLAPSAEKYSDATSLMCPSTLSLRVLISISPSLPWPARVGWVWVVVVVGELIGSAIFGSSILVRQTRSVRQYWFGKVWFGNDWLGNIGSSKLVRQKPQQTFLGWAGVYLLAAAVLGSGGLAFLTFGATRVQEWNSIRR